MLDVVESLLLRGASLRIVFKVFGKLHPRRVLDILELALRKTYEVGVEEKLLAFDVLADARNKVELFEALVSSYDHLDSRHVDGMEYRHLVLARAFLLCIVASPNRNVEREGGCASADAPGLGDQHRVADAGTCDRGARFSEESYIKCVNAVFAAKDEELARETVFACLKKFKSSGCFRVFVVSFIVFSINKLRASGRGSPPFFLSVFARFLDVFSESGRKLVWTTEESAVYAGVLKSEDVGESLAYVARAVFMFLLKILGKRRAAARRETALRGPKLLRASQRAACGDSTGARGCGDTPLAGRGGACPLRSKAQTTARAIRALLKVDMERIGLTGGEKFAAAEILRPHFAHQTPYLRELMVTFFWKMKHQGAYAALLEMARDANTSVRRKVFERLLDFRADRSKLREIVAVYFSLLRRNCVPRTRFDASAVAPPFYLEVEKEIARHFELDNVSVEGVEKAVLVEHYSRYKPLEVSLEAVSGVLDDHEMAKARKNAEYINAILGIVSNIISFCVSRGGGVYMGTDARKRLERFCNTFIFYDVYVNACGRILRALGYTGFNGEGDYYVLVNASLGRKVDPSTGTPCERKALVTYLEHHPEEGCNLRELLDGLFGFDDVLPEYLSLIMRNITGDTAGGVPARKKVCVAEKSTVSEFYFSLVSSNHSALFAAIERVRDTELDVSMYRLLLEATSAGAILPQLSLPYILRIIHRCPRIPVERVASLYSDTIVKTMSDVLRLVMAESGTAPPELGPGYRTGQDASSAAPESCYRGALAARALVEKRRIVSELLAEIRDERERHAFVVKLSSLLTLENMSYVAESLAVCELDQGEIGVLCASLRELAQSVPVGSEATEDASIKGMLVVTIINAHIQMLKTGKAPDIRGTVEMLRMQRYTEEERTLVAGAFESTTVA